MDTDKKQLTKEEFIEYYRHNNPFGEMTREQVLENTVAIRCGCDEEGCLGWAMCMRSPLDVNHHYETRYPQALATEVRSKQVKIINESFRQRLNGLVRLYEPSVKNHPMVSHNPAEFLQPILVDLLDCVLNEPPELEEAFQSAIMKLWSATSDKKMVNFGNTEGQNLTVRWLYDLKREVEKAEASQ